RNQYLDMPAVLGFDDDVELGALDRGVVKQALVVDLDDIAGMLADHPGEPGEGARDVGQFRAQPDQPALMYQTAHQDRGEEPRVDIAAANDNADSPAAKPLRRGQHGGETGGARPLDHQFLTLEQNLDR